MRMHHGRRLYCSADTPLIRSTSVAVDQAGNAWSIKNWVPEYEIRERGKTGSEGFCIFVRFGHLKARNSRLACDSFLAARSMHEMR